MNKLKEKDINKEAIKPWRTMIKNMQHLTDLAPEATDLISEKSTFDEVTIAFFAWSNHICNLNFQINRIIGDPPLKQKLINMRDELIQKVIIRYEFFYKNKKKKVIKIPPKWVSEMYNELKNS